MSAAKKMRRGKNTFTHKSWQITHKYKNTRPTPPEGPRKVVGMDPALRATQSQSKLMIAQTFTPTIRRCLYLASIAHTHCTLMHVACLRFIINIIVAKTVEKKEREMKKWGACSHRGCGGCNGSSIRKIIWSKTSWINNEIIFAMKNVGKAYSENIVSRMRLRYR